MSESVSSQSRDEWTHEWTHPRRLHNRTGPAAAVLTPGRESKAPSNRIKSNPKFTAEATKSASSPLQRLAAPDAHELARAFLAATRAEFAEELKATPLSRAKLSGLRRNASAVLGKGGSAAD